MSNFYLDKNQFYYYWLIQKSFHVAMYIHKIRDFSLNFSSTSAQAADSFIARKGSGVIPKNVLERRGRKTTPEFTILLFFPGREYPAVSLGWEYRRTVKEELSTREFSDTNACGRKGSWRSRALGASFNSQPTVR